MFKRLVGNMIKYRRRRYLSRAEQLGPPAVDHQAGGQDLPAHEPLREADAIRQCVFRQRLQSAKRAVCDFLAGRAHISLTVLERISHLAEVTLRQCSFPQIELRTLALFQRLITTKSGHQTRTGHPNEWHLDLHKPFQDITFGRLS